ncbi:MAG: 1,4-dihydroxy-2-naphthoate polyprenyltransferase [Candidatus Planktophila sp.]|jgi:1,4-dihydroxy-2-naphthoate octaprenyltransferase|nr:1,4-dihydroxy-2-naphthoate polyprenyltransferase [Candidatus Planktophila sp.]
MTSVSKWIAGARPRTLPAAIAPVLVATAYAGSNWAPLRALSALLVSLALQIGVNYANDYSDGILGTDDLRIGPVRLTASGLATPKSVRTAAIISFLFAALIGLTLAAATSWWIILVGALAINAAWGYTGGSNPYGYKGLGEISVFLFFGVVATVGTYYVQTEELNLRILIISIPMGALACAILAINNLRDRAQDEIVGKKTLAVRLGDKGARRLYVALLLSAHLFALFTFEPGALLTLLAAPLTWNLARDVLSGVHGADLIPYLAKTGKLQLVFALLFALGLVI